MLAIFLYGMVRYPDAPIRECIGGFCGKTGLFHSADDYRDFNTWQTTLVVTWLIGMPILWLLQRNKTKGTK